MFLNMDFISKGSISYDFEPVIFLYGFFFSCSLDGSF